MRTASSEELIKNWPRVVADAKLQPVCVQGIGEEMVVMSRDQYQHLTKQAWGDLFGAMDKMAATAVARGLTEELLVSKR
jgi:hypothetical protein